MRQFTRFGAVGIAALLVHWLTVMALVPLGLTPLTANVLAFAVAFQVSYWGHRQWTFAARRVPHLTTLPRFLLIALVGLALNQGAYFLLLRYTGLDYRLSLLIVLLLVAALTFVLSRQWAFR